MNPLALGHILEGTVERDPMTDRYTIMTVNQQGKAEVIDLNALLERFEGREVRLTLASIEDLERLARMVETQGAGVVGVMPEDLPAVPFNIVRKVRPIRF